MAPTADSNRLMLSCGSQVTIRQLLNHTSGVPEYFDQILEMYISSGLGVWGSRLGDEFGDEFRGLGRLVEQKQVTSARYDV